MSDYRHDVYLSWRRAEPVHGWFRRYFFPEFEARLRSTLGHEPRVFVDHRGVETGDDWEARLAKELRGACLLVPIWEPQYFRSPWCVAELEYMADRERFLGYRTADRPEGIILPLVVQDGRHFADWLDRVQVQRLEGVLTDAGAFRESSRYLDFVDGVQRLCDAVEVALERAPPWSVDFPAPKLRELPAAPPILLPRFR